MKPASLILALLSLPALLAASGFAFREDSPGAITLYASGKPLFTYHTAVVSRPGTPPHRARCCYLHPLRTLNGVIVTDDFPSDHLHHRGAFLAWPVVNIDGKRHDLWLLQGIAPRFQRLLERDDATGVLALENAWYAGERKVVKETMRLAASLRDSRSWTLDVAYRLEALDTTVELLGDPTDKKGYGGFNIRFAPRPHHQPADRSPADTRIFTDAGRETADSNMVPHTHARLEGEFDGGWASVSLAEHPSNPGFPNGWCIRHYGFLGVNYPGPDTPHRLTPGAPLLLRYTLTISDASGPPPR